MKTSTAWTQYIARLATRTGRPVVELDREEAQRILAKTLPPTSTSRQQGNEWAERLMSGAREPRPLPADLCTSVGVTL